MIDKILHFVWVGDAGNMPRDSLRSWVKLNCNYTVLLWDQSDYENTNWVNKKHMEAMYPIEKCGVADLMRYEILYRHGGIALDIDSICMRPLDDWLLEPDEIFCWENEKIRPGLIATAIMGARKKSKFFKSLIDTLHKKDSVICDRAWITTGPTQVTNIYNTTKNSITVYPSHYFIPNHFSGDKYTGNGPVYCEQEWGSTVGRTQLT
jgi:mannosyltransferase OCH1-like enzyme